MKRVLLVIAALLCVAVIAGIGFAYRKIRAYDRSIAKVYSVPLEQIEATTSTAALGRGKHLAEAIGGCHSCHGDKFEDGKSEEMGPLGRFQGSNLTRGQGGRGTSYSDAELYRLLRHGIRNDGTSVRFMPCAD